MGPDTGAIMDYHVLMISVWWKLTYEIERSSQEIDVTRNLTSR